MSDTQRDERINIDGIDKVELLMALYDHAMPQGLGLLHYTPQPLTREEAESYLEITHNFDYLRGRVMKVDLKYDMLYPYGYDRDNGAGACEAIVKSLRGNNHE